MTYNEGYALNLLRRPEPATVPPTFATPATYNPASFAHWLSPDATLALEAVLLTKYPYSMRPTLANAKANGVVLTSAEVEAYNRVGTSLI